MIILNNELDYINQLKTNEGLFNEKFRELENDFLMKSPHEVHDFIKDYPGIFLLLDEVKPYLNQLFFDDEYILYVSHDPEYWDDVKLVLLINVDRQRFLNGVSDDINFIRRKIHPLMRKIHILYELLIMPGVSYV